MDQFFLGGEELIVDEICRCVPSGCVRRCMTFEEAAAGTTIEFGETLVEGDNRATGVGFLWPQDDLYFDGEATIVPAAMGQEVQMGNLNLAFTFCEPSPRVTFSYRAFGGDVNLGVQGDLRRVGSFAELDGAMVGGAQVRVTQASIQGGVTGQVAVEGNVGKVTIGGEELFLDDVCP